MTPMKQPTNGLSTLYVDLDGTFTKSDMLFESFIIALKRNPFVPILCSIWLLKGKAYLKYRLSILADIPAELLPLNLDFHSFLLDEKKRNRKIILITASHEKYAKRICDDFDLFDSYLGSDRNTNLKGVVKLRKIQSESIHFSYAGNSSEDFVIFESCAESYLVNPTNRARKLARHSSFTSIFDDTPATWTVWPKQLRVHQWLKNLLIFVPLFVSGYFQSGNSIILSLLGFMSFCCLTSATYIINDLFDLESDRDHHRKKSRPLAVGKISIKSGIIAALTLFSCSFTIALMLNHAFTLILLIYLLLTLSYSLKIKQLPGLDIITLATLHTLRIFAGAALLNIIPSSWLISYSMFTFFSLATIKRCAELKSLVAVGKSKTVGRAYQINDYRFLMTAGILSSLISFSIFCLYARNNVLVVQYQQPLLLWLLTPLLGFWMIRMWLKTHRGDMHHDPIIFTIKDKYTLAALGLMGSITLLAQLL